MVEPAHFTRNLANTDREAVFIGAIVVCFLFVATHDLAHSSLWFDEGVEYWYSRSLIGPIPFNGDAAFNTQNMYERIVTTFQPPLYNVLMYFWLLINDSVWWMRFFGVLMGLVSLFGVYATIRLLSDYKWATAGSVLFTFNYYLCYYWQEFAEYCLMIAFVSWLCFWFTKALISKEFKSVVGFAVCCVGSVYSQYGAALLAIPLGVVLVVSFALEKEAELARKSLLLLVSVAVVAGLPLYWFFLRVQLNNGNTNVMEATPDGFSTIGIIDFLKNWIVVIKGLFFNVFELPVALLFAIVFSVFILVVPIISADKLMRASSIACLLSFAFFYFAVKSGYYSYGTFLGGYNGLRTRYALFFTPYLIILSTLGARTVLDWLQTIAPAGSFIQPFAIGMLSCAVGCYAMMAWSDGISSNWNKSDAGSMVQAWYELGDGSTPVIVYYGADALFSYYVTNDARYNGEVASLIVYQDWMGEADVEALDDSIEYCLGEIGGHPERFYLAACHWSGDLDYMLSYFESAGYTVSVQYSGAGAILYELNAQGAV